jgi:mRNA interferase RelE/StbE
MKVIYERSFLKDIGKVKDQKILDRISETVNAVKSSQNLESVHNVKKLKGNPSAFRIRIGDYRIGFFYENDTVIFSRFLNRKDIYIYFP